MQKPSTSEPLKSFLKKGNLEAGCDEAGRGCLAGPVFASAVILPQDFSSPLLNDSKTLNESLRYSLREEIEKSALAWSVAMVGNEEIDEINILNASIKAMHIAIRKLKIKPEFLLIDGNRFKPYKSIPHVCIIKGDSKYFSIAAASVLAKTYRDDFMKQAHRKNPDYNWEKNKGYPTREHRGAILEKGISPLHRKSFRLIDPQLNIKFQ